MTCYIFCLCHVFAALSWVPCVQGSFGVLYHRVADWVNMVWEIIEIIYIHGTVGETVKSQFGKGLQRVVHEAMRWLLLLVRLHHQNPDVRETGHWLGWAISKDEEKRFVLNPKDLLWDDRNDTFVGNISLDSLLGFLEQTRAYRCVAMRCLFFLQSI